MTQATVALALGHAFLHVYHQDHANAAMHCAATRYSPITFRLAEAIHATSYDEDLFAIGGLADAVGAVMRDRGAYEEDEGR